MRRLRLPRPGRWPARGAAATQRSVLAAAPYVVGRDDRGRTICSSAPTLPRRP
jgi:hypothetical protein